MTRGRPAVGPRLVVRLPDPLRAKLNAYAERRGVPVSEAVRSIIDQGLRSDELEGIKSALSEANAAMSYAPPSQRRDDAMRAVFEAISDVNYLIQRTQ